jgi:hypothetical protein
LPADKLLLPLASRLTLPHAWSFSFRVSVSVRGLTPRSKGPATAGFVRPACGTPYIVTSRPYKPRLRGPLSSNVRRRKHTVSGMKPTLRTRKPIDQLRLRDITAFSVWEFATDEEDRPGQDETWVKPVNSKVVPANAFSFSVAAKFKTASGMELRGIVGVNTMGSLEVIHAAVITEDNYVFIPWPGYPGARRSFQVASRELGISESDLFPLKYELLVPIEGVRETVHGEYAYGDA